MRRIDGVCIPNPRCFNPYEFQGVYGHISSFRLFPLETVTLGYSAGIALTRVVRGHCRSDS